MKKIFAKVTAIISAAAMLTAPMLNVATVNAATVEYYYRSLWTDYMGTGPSAHEEILVGDANGSGTITMADATAILQHLTNPDKCRLTGDNLKNADANGDGMVTAKDALIIQKVLNKTTTFKAEQVYFQALGNKYNQTATYRIFKDFDNGGYMAVLPGDVNNSGTITYADVVAFRQAEATGQGFHIFGADYRRAGRAADMNNNCVVNDVDLSIIYELIG